MVLRKKSVHQSSAFPDDLFLLLHLHQMNQLLTLLLKYQLEVSMEVGRDKRYKHPVLSNQGLLGEKKTRLWIQ